MKNVCTQVDIKKEGGAANLRPEERKPPMNIASINMSSSLEKQIIEKPHLSEISIISTANNKGTKSMNNSKHIYTELYPHLPQLYPQLSLVEKGDRLTATTNDIITMSDGHPVRPDRIEILKINKDGKTPSGLLVHGEDSIPLTHLYHHITTNPSSSATATELHDLHLTSREYTNVLRSMCEVVGIHYTYTQDIVDILWDAAKISQHEHQQEEQYQQWLDDRNLSDIDDDLIYIYNTKAWQAAVKDKNQEISEDELKKYITYGYKNRVLIPVRDAHGNLITYSARTITTSDTPKYRNLYNHPIPLLIGYDHLDPEKSSTHPLIICEGFIDHLKISKMGYPNILACGTTGNKLVGSKDSVKTFEDLKNMGFDHIILALDNDGAGMASTFKILTDTITNQVVKITTVPHHTMNVKDPDELVRDGDRSKLTNLISQAIPLDTWYPHYLETITDTEKKTREELIVNIDNKYKLYKDSLDGTKYVADEFDFHDFVNWLGAKYYRDDDNQLTLCYYDDNFYRFFEDSGWKCITRKELETEISKIIEFKVTIENPTKYTVRLYNEIISDITRSYIFNFDHMVDKIKEKGYVSLSNNTNYDEFVATKKCLVNIKTTETIPLMPDYFSVYPHLNVEYTKTEKEVVERESYKYFKNLGLDENDIKNIIKWAYLAMLPNHKNPTRKMLWLVGPTASGKSTTAKMFGNLMGHGTALLSMSNLDYRFFFEHKINKKLIIMNEANGTGNNTNTNHLNGIARNTLKTLTANDPMPVLRKGISEISVNTICALITTSNTPPDFAASDPSIASRLLMIHFPKSFTAPSYRSQADTHIDNKISDPIFLNDLLNLILTYGKELSCGGEDINFCENIITKSLIDTKSLDNFISTHFDYKKDYKVAVKDIYEAYRIWHESVYDEDDEKPLGKQKFLEKWSIYYKEYPIKDKARPSYGGDPVKCIINLIPKVKNNDTLPKEDVDEEEERKEELEETQSPQELDDRTDDFIQSNFIHPPTQGEPTDEPNTSTTTHPNPTMDQDDEERSDINTSNINNTISSIPIDISESISRAGNSDNDERDHNTPEPSTDASCSDRGCPDAVRSPGDRMVVETEYNPEQIDLEEYCKEEDETEDTTDDGGIDPEWIF